MNFSEPRSGATTVPTMNTNTPLDFALSLISSDDTHKAPNIHDTTNLLAGIHHASYLLLLPRSSRAEKRFHKHERLRIASRPYGKAVLQALNAFTRHDVGFVEELASDAVEQMELIYEATGRMLLDLEEEQRRYWNNMTLLYASLVAKWNPTVSWEPTATKLGSSGLVSAQTLFEQVGGHITPPYHAGYLSEIARYWRTWAPAGESKMYEEVWTFVAGRPLVEE